MDDERRKRCCVNCRHNIRTGKFTYIKCHCEIDGHYIGYLDAIDGWCRRWATDKDKWEVNADDSNRTN